MSGLGDAIDQPTREMSAIELPTPNGDAPVESSMVASLRARAALLRQARSVDLPIPGYGGELVGRYRAINLAKYNKVGADGFTNPLTEWHLAADALATALLGIYGREVEGGPLLPFFNDQVARYDDDLVQALALEPTEHTARGVLVALCGGGEDGEWAVWRHFIAYQAWLEEEPAQEVADRAVGEHFPAS